MDEVDVAIAHDGTYHSHQSTSGNESGSQQRTFFAACRVDGFVLAAGSHVPVDGSTHQQREVQFQGDEHTQREGQGRHLAEGQYQCQYRTDAIEQPWSTYSVHQRVDDSCHGVGLWGSQLSAGESIRIVQYHDDAAYGSCRNQCAKELPAFLLLGCATQPVTDFQVGDETSGHGQCGADHATHYQGSHHTRGTFQAHGHHDDGSQDQGHQGHARYRVRTDDGDGIGRHGGEEEGDSRYQQDGYYSMQNVALHHVEIEEEYHEQQGEQRTEGDDFHGQVFLCAFHAFFGLFSFHLIGSQADRTLDDAP